MSSFSVDVSTYPLRREERLFCVSNSPGQFFLKFLFAKYILFQFHLFSECWNGRDTYMIACLKLTTAINLYFASHSAPLINPDGKNECSYLEGEMISLNSTF